MLPVLVPLKSMPMEFNTNFLIKSKVRQNVFKRNWSYNPYNKSLRFPRININI